MDRNDAAATTGRLRIFNDYSYGTKMTGACHHRRCPQSCGDDYSWPVLMVSAANCLYPFYYCPNLHYCLRLDHFRYRRQLIPLTLDDSPASANWTDASFVPARTGPFDGATSSASFGLKEGCRSPHFAFVVHCHLLRLKKSSIKIECKTFDLHLGYLTRCC